MATEKRRPAAAAGARPRSRRRKTVLITAAVVAVVIALLIWEQVAYLYVLSTLAVVALLAVVAFSDIGAARQPASEPPPFDDSAALADGLTAQNASAPRPAPRARRRA